MKESLENFLVGGQSNGLYVYEMPTGSGKTYKAAKFIHDFLIDNYADSKIKRVFYLTPQRKNVKGSINEVEKIFSDDKKDGKMQLIILFFIFKPTLHLFWNICWIIMEKMNSLKLMNIEI